MSSTSTGGEHFSLVWNTFPRNLSAGLYSLLTNEHLVDVTLAAEGQILRAHKIVLSVCSTYFRDLFKGNTCEHPIVILKDINYRDLSAMLHFMYQGEVNIKQEDIDSFLKVAEILKIKGLTRTNDDDDEADKELVDALPLVHHDRPNAGNVSAPGRSASTPESFSEPAKNWNSSCHCRNRTPKEEGCSKTFRESVDPLSSDSHLIHTESGREMLNLNVDDEPLDCSASIEDKPHKASMEYPEYKPDLGLIGSEIRHLTPEVECIQRPMSAVMPHIEQENVDAMLNTQMMGYSNPHCQNDPVGFHDTGTTCPSDYLPDPSTSCSSNTTSKGRRTVKGLPGSSLSLETTLRVISELGPTIRMERGKVIRMYSCPWCLRHFTRKENLKLHVRYIHGPLESLTCKLCGNKYKNSNSLRVHSYLYHNAQRNNKSSSSTTGNKPSIVGGNA
ncbi:zinc finger and BTB domain-containing protein 37-like [Copidosoma floridanum]|uniref:zinc finger and BTB domain-containing protein 37-like n=1 Tax=Copidosoma floridanum TaxID=29053 RepID=UPI0006C96D27|nr:zinc finger and BTB domain-containing protein 37-like [Copidosoma floridanum]